VGYSGLSGTGFSLFSFAVRLSDYAIQKQTGFTGCGKMAFTGLRG
jgi:hypothetical protein